jgi:hypothetical protein
LPSRLQQSSTTSNAPEQNDQVRFCWITHPFHPSYGKKIKIVQLRQSWGQDLVFYHHEDGRLTYINALWTDVYEPDPFNAVSDGRSIFRFQELLELFRLIDNLMQEEQ